MEITLGQVLLISAAGGLLCLLLNRRLRAVSASVALIASAWTFWLCIDAFRKAPVVDQFSWYTFDFSAFQLVISMRVTAFSGLIMVGIAFFSVLVTIYSLRYARKITEPGKYYAYLLWTLTGALAAAMANNLILFLMAWEFVTLMLYLLIGLGREGSPQGAFKTFVLLGLSDGALLLAIVLMAFFTPQGALLTLGGSGDPVQVNTPVTYLIYLLFMLAAITKAGAMPLHTWIPTASMGAPLSVMAYLPAALDKLLGIYFLALVSFKMFKLDASAQMVLMIIGAVTILCAVMMAMVQHDVRKLLSYHAVSQVGYMVLGIGTGTIIGVAGGLFHMINNAIYKSCLFMGAGAVEDRTGETDLDKLGGLARVMPATFVCMLVAALSISGVPPFNGFVSKWMVYQATLQMGAENPAFSSAGIIFLIVAVFGSALTLASFVKVLHSMFFGFKAEGMKEETARLGGKLSLGAPMVLLAVLCIVFGIGAQLPLADLVAPAMAELGFTPEAMATQLPVTSDTLNLQFATGLWSPSLATLLILVGIVLGLVIFALGAGRKGRLRVQPPYLAGETYSGDDARMRASGFYRTVSELPILRTIYRDAEGGAYDPYHVGGHYGHTLVEFLRHLHSGVLPLYISWCIIGLAIIIAWMTRL